MGWGDELMAAGIAERMFELAQTPVAILDRHGRVRWSDVWAHNPAIATPQYVRDGRGVQFLTNGEGCRPYIQYPFTPQTGIRFTDWRARDWVGRLYLTDAERAVGERLRAELGRFLVIEPDIKRATTPNKAWGVARFARVAAAMPDLSWVRVSFDEPRAFDGARQIVVRTFREACAVIAASAGYVGTEGGYHHAAGVLRKPAVVIFGGFISPATTGYPWHTNLADRGRGSPCGRWRLCHHCLDAMARISEGDVITSIRGMLAQAPQTTEATTCP